MTNKYKWTTARKTWFENVYATERLVWALAGYKSPDRTKCKHKIESKWFKGVEHKGCLKCGLVIEDNGRD